MEATTRLYGRDRERASLRELLADLLEGRGGLVLIGGEAGIGKTALVEDLLQHTIGRGVRILTGSCFDLDTPPPFSAWRGIASELPGADQPSNLETILVEASAHQPLLVVLEDVHWADPTSLELLRVVGRTADNLALLIVATYRDDHIAVDHPLFHYLPLLVREARAERIHLRPLEDEALRELVADRYGLPAQDVGRLVHVLLDRTEGNPFFIQEYLRALEDDGQLRRDESGWRLADPLNVETPQLVQATIARRFAGLAPEEREALAVLALIGQRPSLDIWRRLVGFDDAACDCCLQAAGSAGILTIEGSSPRVRFNHALIRETLARQLPVMTRQRYHERIAEQLMAQPEPDPETIAHHLLQTKNPQAAEWLIRAARGAGSMYAERTAIRLYERAVGLLARQPERNVERAWLLCELALAYRHVDPGESQRRLEDAFALLPQADDPALDVVVRWNRARIRAFRNEPALDEMRAAVAAYESLSQGDRQRVSESPLGFLTSWGAYAQVLAGHGQYLEARGYAHRHLQESGPPRSEREHIDHAHARYGLALAAAALGEPDQAREEFARARAHYREGHQPHGAGLMLDWEIDVVLSVFAADAPAERREHLAEMAALADQSVFSAPLGFAADLLDGRWQELRERVTALLAFEVLDSYTYRFLAEIDRLQGSYERAARQIGRIMPDGPATQPGARLFHNLLETQRIAAELALDRDLAGEAGEWIEAHRRWLDWSGELAGYPRLHLLQARLADLHGDMALARRRVTEALELASAPRQPLVQLESHLLLARLDLAAGCPEAAGRNIDTAQHIALVCDAPYETATCKLAAAELASAREQFTQARSLLEAARELATPLQACPLLARIAKIERRVSASGGPVPLTPRQLEVLQLLASGLTNAEIAERLYLSPRTVDQHLRRIYAAFDVSSRAAATRYALDHGLISESV